MFCLFHSVRLTGPFYFLLVMSSLAEPLGNTGLKCCFPVFPVNIKHLNKIVKLNISSRQEVLSPKTDVDICGQMFYKYIK